MTGPEYHENPDVGEKPSHKRRPVLHRDEVLRVRPDLDRQTWEAADRLFTVRVTRSFAERMNLHDPMDPLAMQVLPDARELTADAEDLDDPVGDDRCSPLPWVVHKYPDRVLLLLTKRCHLYCRYCFRRTHEPGGLDPTAEELDAAVRYIEQHKPREVILSGGDPLVVADKRLWQTLDRLCKVTEVIRIHTRAPITFPQRVTPEFVRGLRQRAPLFLLVHVNHPRELSADVDRALAMLVDAGIPVFNQAVLLRGVNDDADVLVDLFEALLRRRVKPYYLHHTDKVTGNAHFRVTLEQGRSLMRQVRERVGGLALPVYVLDPPDGSGKRPIAY